MRQELVQLGNGAHALATQILGNSDDAADAVHDAFATALGKPRHYDPAKGSVRVWFLSIVRYRCLDLLRQRRPTDHEIDSLESPVHEPSDMAERAQDLTQLRVALAKLPLAQQEIIILRDYLDLSYTEVAQTLELPAGTVMSRLHRARLALSKAFGEESKTND